MDEPVNSGTMVNEAIPQASVAEVPSTPSQNNKRLYVLLGILAIVMLASGIIWAITNNSSATPTVKNNTTALTTTTSTITATLTPTAVPSQKAPTSASVAAGNLNTLEQQLSANVSSESTDFTSMNSDIANASQDGSDSTSSSQL